MKRFILFLIVAITLIFGLLLLWSFLSGTTLSKNLLSSHPVLPVIIASIGLILTSFIFGLISKDYSWVDRLWSTAPVVFVWFYALRGGFSLPLLLMAILVTVWGLRLTWNFARKDGYNGTEDYRWSILRQKIPNPLLWQLFNFGFICTWQIGLFILFTLPIGLMATLPSTSPIPLLFWPTLGLMAIFLLIETIADIQQWDFYQTRGIYKKNQDVFSLPFAQDAAQGFLSSGLYRFSRHPNYFGEQGFWLATWLAYSALLTNLLNWGILGPIFLILLFIGSTIFTEGISSQKYPAYKAYQQRTSPIIPWFPRK